MEKNGVVWLEFEQLAGIEGIEHGVFTRQGPCECLDPLNVEVHRRAVELAFGRKHLVMGKQVHGTFVKRVDGCEEGLNRVEDCDGAMTKKTGVTLLSRHADCQVVLFFDPVHKAIANVHCGWRGSVRGMLPKTVQGMREQYGSHPKDLLVCISPSLGPMSAEFRHFKDELPEEFYPFQIKPTYFNFWDISRHQLKQAGVLERHIECAEICTVEKQQDFYSYRRDGLSGRNVTSLMLKD